MLIENLIPGTNLEMKDTEFKGIINEVICSTLLLLNLMEEKGSMSRDNGHICKNEL